jgi:O-methyltransferase
VRHFFYTSVRPKLKNVAAKLGYERGASPQLKVIPTDFDEQTKRIIRAVDGYTMTSPERLEALVSAVRYVVTNNIAGDFVECGVWRGGSTMAAALTLKDMHDDQRNLYLYDTFEGMSAPTDDDITFDGQSAEKVFNDRKLSQDSSEWCKSTLDEVKEGMAKTNYPIDKTYYIKGKVEETIPREMPANAVSILRLDTDFYESTRHELRHLFPRLVKGGVLIIDDYGHWEGSKKAVDEYIAENKLQLLLNRVDDSGRIAIKM